MTMPVMCSRFLRANLFAWSCGNIWPLQWVTLMLIFLTCYKRGSHLVSTSLCIHLRHGRSTVTAHLSLSLCRIAHRPGRVPVTIILWSKSWFMMRSSLGLLHTFLGVSRSSSPSSNALQWVNLGWWLQKAVLHALWWTALFPMSLLMQFCLTTCCSLVSMMSSDALQLRCHKTNWFNWPWRFQSSQVNPHLSRGQGPVVLSRWRSAVSMPHIEFRS